MSKLNITGTSHCLLLRQMLRNPCKVLLQFTPTASSLLPLKKKVTVLMTAYLLMSVFLKTQVNIDFSLCLRHSPAILLPTVQGFSWSHAGKTAITKGCKTGDRSRCRS